MAAHPTLVPDRTVSEVLIPPLFPKKNEPLAALALLADVLRPLGNQDRDSGCAYVLGGRWDFHMRPETLRSEAKARVESLSKAIGELPPSADVSSKHLHDEARDWLVWLAGFGVAQEEIARRYYDLRTRTRWKTHIVTLTDLCDDRLVLERMHANIVRGLEVCEPVHEPRAADSTALNKFILIIKTFCYLLLLCPFILQFWALAYWAVTFRLGYTDYRKQIEGFHYYTFTLVSLVAICLYFTFITYATNSSTTRLEYELMRIRGQSHRWLLAWKALGGMARKMLDDERIYENRGQHIIHILAQMDHLIECPHENRATSNELTVLESLNAHTIHLPAREALARVVVARIRPLIDGKRRGCKSTNYVSSDGPQTLYDVDSARINEVIATACSELSIRDALFMFFVRLEYGVLHTQALPTRTSRPHTLGGPVDELVQTLKKLPPPRFIQATNQLFFDNMYARLAWIGGLGRAQSEIQQNLATLGDAPGPAQLQRVSDVVGHHLRALQCASLASFHDLFAAPRGRQVKAVLMEVLKCFIPSLFIFPLFVIPTIVGGDGLVDGLFGIAYVWIVRTHLEPISLCALKGLQDYACSYRGDVWVQNVREAAARVELYARFHLVHWKLLQKVTDALLQQRDSDDSATLGDLHRLLATLRGSNDPSTNNISVALDSALNKRTEQPLEAGTYAHADVVRSLIDEHYPFFQAQTRLRGHKRGRRGQADAEDWLTLADESIDDEGPLRQRLRARADLPEDSTTWV